MLPASTAAQNGSVPQQIIEGGARMAPQLIAAAATSGSTGAGAGLFGATGATAKTLATVLEGTQFFAQTAGQSYQGIYDAAKKGGYSDQQASLAAGIGATIDGVVATATMKFGALGQMEQRGLRTYLANIIRSAGAQGGVAATQDLVNQLTHYVASNGGEGVDVDRILKAGLQGVVAGAFTMASDPSRVRAAWDTFSNTPSGDAAADAANRMSGKFGDVGMSESDALSWLGLKQKTYTAADVIDAFKEKVKQAHPDAGGTQEDFAKTMAARAALMNALRGGPSPTSGASTSRQPESGGGSQPEPPPAPATSSTANESGSGNEPLGAQNPPPETAIPANRQGANLPNLPATTEQRSPAAVGEGTAAEPRAQFIQRFRTWLDTVAPKDESGQRQMPAVKELLDGLRGNQELMQQLQAQRQRHENLAQEIERLDQMYGDAGQQTNQHADAQQIVDRVRAENRAPAERLENEGGVEAPRGKSKGTEGPGTNYPRELSDAYEVGQWYGKQFKDSGGADAIEALASMSGGKYVLAEVPSELINPSSLVAGDKDQSKIDQMNKLTPEQRAALPPAILVSSRKGDELMVADGSHRTQSAQQSGYPTVRAYVPERFIGTKGIEAVRGTVPAEHRHIEPERSVARQNDGGGASAPTPAEKPGKMERQQRPTTPPPAKPKEFDEALRGSLFSHEGARDRFEALAETGADDATLNSEIGRAFGIQGGHPLGDHKGGKNPKFWAAPNNYGQKPTLQGKRLVDEVRRLLQIPRPEDVKLEGDDDGHQHSSDEVRATGQGTAAGGTDGAGSAGALEESSSAPASPTEPGGATGQREPSGGAPRSEPLHAPDRERGGSTEGDGGREGQVHLPDRQGRRAADDAGGSAPGQGAAGGELPKEPGRSTDGHDAPALSGDHHITDPSKLEAGGAKTKFKNNIAAIEIMRRALAEGRRATPAEQETLATYSGWGQFPQLFNEYAKAEGKWDDERKLLKEMLTPDEWEAARKSTLNAHYSSPLLAKSMWDAMQRLGFEGGRVLEPSMGAGIFFGLMPRAVHANSRLTGVELDPVTGNIARLLYPDANVQVKGYQDLVAPPAFFDTAIGNVPFGDYPVHDNAYKQLRTAPIHDYFIVKTLDMVRPGGVVALITSTGTMDKQDNRWRKMMAEKADLLGAMRLPEGAFSKSAGTEVVTDLLIFRRRAEGEAPAGPAFSGLEVMPDPDKGDDIPINEYFADHPQQILGTLDRKSRLYGRGDSHVSRTDDFEQRLADAIARLPEGAYKPAIAEHLAKRPKEAAPASAKDGAYVKDGKKLLRRQGNELVDAGADSKTGAIISDTLLVRDALRDLVNSELANADAGEIDQKRRALGKAYDAFVKKNGPLHKRTNMQAFADDPDSPVVLALEHVDPKTREVTKADVFKKSTIRGYTRPTSADSVGAALGISLNETAGVDLQRIGELLGKSKAQAGEELVKARLAFENPAGGWESAERYLSGNVLRKLLEARDAAAADARYRPNVEALEKVQPADVPHDEIDVRLGAPWIPTSDIADFAQHVMGGVPEHFAIRYIPTQGTWIAGYTPTGSSRHKGSPNDTTVFGTERAGFIDVLEAALNNKSITITDRDPGDSEKRILNKEATAAANEKIEKLQQIFHDWVWDGDERRRRLHRYYNDTFNNLAPVKYDGSHLQFPGMNPAISLNPHQINAAWQAISTGTALFGHEVGTGKTYTMVAAAMELRRLGLAHKPAIATIKAAFETVVKQARALYPSAKILAVDDFEAKNRKRTISRIATGDWDLVVMTHDQMDMLPMDPQVEAGFIRREIEELEEVKRSVQGESSGNAYGRRSRSQNDNRMVKALEKQKARLEARLLEALDSKKDNAVTFEQTGIDQLFVDEAHRYKSLPVYTKQDRVKGIPKSRSDRATNMWMRAQWLQQMNKGRGVVFATGTPVTNTMAELYTMQRYLQMRELEQRGVAAFDAWASTFGRLVTKMEFTVTGDFAPTTRFAAFTNMPELQQIARQAVDIQRAKDLPGFKRPKRKDVVVKAPMSHDQKGYLSVIKDRAKEAKKKRPGEPGDNMLSISMDARKSALDHRIVDAGADDYEHSKTNKIVANVLRILEEHPGTTQMIFSDLGVHESDGGFSWYQNIIDKLVKGGVPRDKILNFGDLTDAQKKLAADRLAAADAWIGIGGSEKLGTGVNAQQHLIALHHADVPWVPAFVEQRDGRGWRQGNLNPEIQIYRYVTEGSFDTFMWQAVDAKTRFIQQFMEGKKIARAISEDDGEELSPAQVMAIASGNPLLLDKIQLEKDVNDLTAAANRHQREQLKLRDERVRLAEDIEANKKKAVDLAPDLATAAKHADAEFSIELDGKTYTDRQQAQDKLDQLVEKLPSRSDGSHRVVLGHYRGFPLEGYRAMGAARVVLAGNVLHEAESSIGSIDYRARPSAIQTLIDRANQLVQVYTADLAKLGNTSAPFPKASELASKQVKLKEVTDKLAAQNKPEDQDAPGTSTAVQEADEDDDDSAYLRGDDSDSRPHNPTPLPMFLNSNQLHGPAAAGGRKVLRPLEMPELLRLAKELMQGNAPIVKKIRGKAMGKFEGAGFGKISIDPRRVKGAHELAAVLAHEVGHLEDWLPFTPGAPGTLSRGNIVGRIRKLTSFMGRTSQGVGPNAALRKELIELSEWWSPYDKQQAKKSYIAYREQPRELYAELLSVLLNAPGEVQARAPLAYKQFLEALDRHPDFRDTYLELQDLLNGTPEELAQARRKDIREAYARGEEIWKARAQERKTNRRSIIGTIKQLFLDRAEPLLAKQRAAEAKLGSPLPDGLNAKAAVAELAYSDNTNHLMLREIEQTVVAPVTHAGMTLDDIGEYLQLHRTATERSEMANPQGHSPATARATLKDLENHLGPVRFATLESAVRTFHEVVFDAVERAGDVGVYAKAKVLELEKNKYNYATFAVLDYLSDHITHAIIQQHGTYKDVANPFTATVLKTMSLNRMNDLTEAQTAAINMLLAHFPKEIEKAPLRRGAGGIPLPPRKPPEGRDWLPHYEDGVLRHYAVDPYIVSVFKNHDVGMLATVGRWMSMITYKPLHPLYVTWNVGWAMGLIPSDFQRTWRNNAFKNKPVTLREILRAYWKAAPIAYRRVRRVPDATIDRMLEAKALDVPWQDFEFHEEHETFARQLDRYGLGNKPKKGGVLRSAVQFVQKLQHGVEGMGSFIVSVPKIAGWQMMGARGLSDRQRADRVRNFFGHPDRKKKGSATILTNPVLMYSNILVQFLRADYEAATDPQTRSGFWLRWGLINGLPKMLMRLAQWGLMGATLAALMKLIPDTDKEKGITIPLGFTHDPQGNVKARYLLIPADPWNRLTGGLLWKLTDTNKQPLMQRFQSVLDTGYSDAPHISPSIEAAINWGLYLRGQNPYDDFRRRNIISDDDFKAGGWYAFKDMLSWTGNQLGQISVLAHWLVGKSEGLGEKETVGEKIIGSVPGVARFIKTSDRGIREQEEAQHAIDDAEAARFRLGLPDDVRNLVRERFRLELQKENISDADRERRAELNRWYGQSYLRLTKAIKAAQKDKDASAEQELRAALLDSAQAIERKS